MRMPDLSETIVAVASAWQPSRSGILRVSGPAALTVVARALGDEAHADSDKYPCVRDVRIAVGDCGTVSVTLLMFRGPRSYTGQDVVELHLPGNLPLLREIAGRLIAAGARRALPGEFSARAFVLGKLDRSQADGVLGLVHAESEAGARQSTRLVRGEASRLVDEVGRRLLDLLARIEAGIDFVDEEDVHFVTADEARVEIHAIAALLRGAAGASAAHARRTRPHVAMAGLPNAGKSTLFNALLGFERAIVSPVIGTTRDVLSAEPVFDGMPVVLQDTAGLGCARGTLELAAHVAAEAAADEADVVLWVHDISQPWGDDEVAALRQIGGGERVCVLTKADLVGDEPSAECGGLPSDAFADVLRVCAVRGIGLAELRSLVAARLRRKNVGGNAALAEHEAVGEHLKHAGELLNGQTNAIAAPELVAMELRTAWEWLERSEKYEATEEVLGRIFTRFCIGK